MSGFSLKTGFSCLPMIGPFVSEYNSYQASKKSSNLYDYPKFNEACERKKEFLTPPGTSERIKEWAPLIITPFNACNQEISDAAEDCILAIQEKGLCAIYGLVGNALSVAVVVSCVAFGVLGIVPAVSSLAFFTALALKHGIQLNQALRSFKAAQRIQLQKENATDLEELMKAPEASPTENYIES